MPIDAGDAVPEVDLFTMTDGKPGKISTSEIFGSGTVSCLRSAYLGVKVSVCSAPIQ